MLHSPGSLVCRYITFWNMKALWLWMCKGWDYISLVASSEGEPATKRLRLPSSPFLIKSQPVTMTKESAKLSKFSSKTLKPSGYWCLSLANSFVSTVCCIDSGFGAQKTFFPQQHWCLNSSDWNKTVNSSRGQCNYLGSGHVTEINMTQSTQPLSLTHDKVLQFFLSIRNNGLLD